MLFLETNSSPGAHTSLDRRSSWKITGQPRAGLQGGMFPSGYQLTSIVFLITAWLPDGVGAWGREAPTTPPPTCDRLVERFISDQGVEITHPQLPSDLLFFIHVPRTAGKTYASCFMKAAHPPSKRCAVSYDELRYNISSKGCALLISHEDYSATQVRVG
jgi:hypothetical protein